MAEKRSSKRHPDHQAGSKSGPSSQRGIDKATLHIDGVPVPRGSVPPSSGRIIGGAVLLAPVQEEESDAAHVAGMSSDSAPPPSSIGSGPVSEADIEAFRGFVPSPSVADATMPALTTSTPISDGASDDLSEEQANFASFVPPPPVSTRIPIPIGMMSSASFNSDVSPPPGELETMPRPLPLLEIRTQPAGAGLFCFTLQYP